MTPILLRSLLALLMCSLLAVNGYSADFNIGNDTSNPLKSGQALSPADAATIADALQSIYQFDPEAAVAAALAMGEGSLEVGEEAAPKAGATPFTGSDGDTIMINLDDIRGAGKFPVVVSRFYHEIQHWREGLPGAVNGGDVNGGLLTPCEHVGAYALSRNVLAGMSCEIASDPALVGLFDFEAICAGLKYQLKKHTVWSTECAAGNGSPVLPGTNTPAPPLVTPCGCG